MKSFLNIAAGKLTPIDFSASENNFLINLDSMYSNSLSMSECESNHELWLNGEIKNKQYRCMDDAFQFLGTYYYQFDHISCYRFLEHVSKPEIQTFIYLLSTAVKNGGIVDIIVPNFETLAKMILNENIDDKVSHQEWERHDTTLTYELLNEPSMPHASIWTCNRMKYFFGLEERFKLISMDPAFKFDGRDMYIRGIFERVSLFN